ncbi:MAG TPA: MaoC family dehydratase N-terminal domain-containing protein [Methylomirabilota bacterium]|jgi:acyl dehydratase
MKTFDYEHLEVGEDLGTRVIEVTDDLVRECAETIESRHEWYRQDSPFGERIAPPTLLDNECLRILDTRYARFGSIHAKQSWRFRVPIRVGSRLAVNVRISDKYVRRGKGYFVMTLTATDETGEVVCTGLHTSVVSLVNKPTEVGG